jgi:hypothetical protein
MTTKLSNLAAAALMLLPLSAQAQVTVRSTCDFSDQQVRCETTLDRERPRPTIEQWNEKAARDNAARKLLANQPVEVPIR